MSERGAQADAIPSKKLQDSFLGKRFEFKYELSVEQAERLEKEVAGLGLVRDLHADQGVYTVNSIYFDTPHLDDYRDKDGSFLRRKKLRVRSYNKLWSTTPEKVWFEVKKKHNFFISKHRAEAPGEMWQPFFNSGSATQLFEIKDQLTGRDRDELAPFARFFTRGNYRPHIMVRYERTAYLTNFVSRVRITFDRNIEVSRAHLGGVEESRIYPVHYGTVIMEVKFDKVMPWWFTNLLTKHNIRRQDFSKYTLSVDELRDRLHIPIPR